MKRDWKLIRALLIASEADAGPDAMRLDADATPGLVDAHLRLMREAGYIVGGPPFGTLTNRGHDVLEAIGDDAVWAKTYAHIADRGECFTEEIVLAVAQRCKRVPRPAPPSPNGAWP